MTKEAATGLSHKRLHEIQNDDFHENSRNNDIPDLLQFLFFPALLTHRASTANPVPGYSVGKLPKNGELGRIVCGIL